ncbi:hypothetical protein Hanom_Chr15g01395031 [Helianthus anomalus]
MFGSRVGSVHVVQARVLFGCFGFLSDQTQIRIWFKIWSTQSGSSQLSCGSGHTLLTQSTPELTRANSGQTGQLSCQSTLVNWS